MEDHEGPIFYRNKMKTIAYDKNWPRILFNFSFFPFLKPLYYYVLTNSKSSQIKNQYSKTSYNLTEF